ncbi:phosphonate metabolism transcriptional regulator PhnF [Crocosphaera chwakensis]|uniref:Transcriptional regulator, GntR family protein n=1 Tax=Crocosphaera chwakensis CCY0110 TaxID=391612 RepID=A3IUL6_9CHRO|nr:phosphonate metabolism transcriptional regulator PhnF [Crocosphaera chwakensis]EAZ89808.1 transcriptional regulator, GntR family protein [Crocosphaera chwakensis CCY0110]
MKQNKKYFLYQKIADILIKDINQKKYTANEVLPSEKKLAERYKVNRSTIRQAIDILLEKDLVYRRQGSGTFVKENKLTYHLNDRSNFTQNLLEIGYLPCLKIISSKLIPAPFNIANSLNITQNDLVFRIKTLRSAFFSTEEISDKEITPLCLSTSYFVEKKCPNLLSSVYQTNSIYSLLKNRYNISPYRTKNIVEVSLSNREDNQYLNIQKNSPILISISLVKDSDENFFEYTVSRFSGEIVSFEISFPPIL